MREADQLLGVLADVLAGVDEGRSAPDRLCAAIPRLLPDLPGQQRQPSSGDDVPVIWANGDRS